MTKYAKRSINLSSLRLLDSLACIIFLHKMHILFTSNSACLEFSLAAYLHEVPPFFISSKEFVTGSESGVTDSAVVVYKAQIRKWDR